MSSILKFRICFCKKNKWFVFEVKIEKFSFFSQKCGRRQGKAPATPLIGAAPCMTGALAGEGGGLVAIRLWTTTSTPVEDKGEGGFWPSNGSQLRGSRLLSGHSWNGRPTSGL